MPLYYTKKENCIALMAKKKSETVFVSYISIIRELDLQSLKMGTGTLVYTMHESDYLRSDLLMHLK